MILSENWRETQCQIMHRAYLAFFRPPDSLSNTKVISRCPKCRSLKPTLAHCLWTCPQIQAFWKQIHAYINRVKHIHRIRDPLLYLFGITSDPSSRKGVPSNQISRWIYVCLIMAKRCILKCWIHPQPPTMHLFILERRDAELSSSKRNSAFFNC